MSGIRKCLIAVLLLQAVFFSQVCATRFTTHGRYVKCEEKGTQSRLRFTSGSYGFYNASIKESDESTIKSDMKMGMYIYDPQTQINFEIDDFKRFSVKPQKIEDFVFLRIKPNGILNSNTQSVYTLNVIALDNRTKEIIDTTKVFLNVLDHNEFKPEFDNQSIRVFVEENVKVGSTILRVSAKDADSGLNGEVYYFIPAEEVLQVDVFSLNLHTGAVSLVKPLNFDKRSSYSFHIIARDKCPYDKLKKQSVPLLVTVNVKDVAGYPNSSHKRGIRRKNYDPNKFATLKFSQNVYIASLAEISPPFTPVIQVKMERLQQSLLPKVVFGFREGNEERCFQINSRTGHIYSVKGLDFETTESYNLTVIAYHDRRITGKTNVIINVLDSNDNSPVFKNLQTNIEVLEETPVGTVIYSAKAIDADKGLNGKIFYSTGNTKSTYFDIDHYTGNVQVAKRLDRDSEQSTPPMLYLLIKAADFGTPVRREGRMILKIKVKKINDNPPVLPFFSCKVKIASNARIGSKVLKITTLDLDKSSADTTFNTSGSILGINSVTGDVTLSSLPSANRVENLNVVAYDGKFISKINFTVFVVPETVYKKINVTCMKNSQYHHVESIIHQRENLKKEAEVEKFSPIVLPQRKIHKPVILEKPDNPITVREDLPIGSIVARVLAVDRELRCYGLVLYSIVSGSNNVDSNFNVDMLNGTIFLTGKIDREKTPSYSLKIRAWDTDNPPQFTDVDIQILLRDVNDNSPVFSHSRFEVTVSEKTQPGSVILPIKATDLDNGRNGEVVYSMISDFEHLFSLNKYTGMLKLNAILDYEEKDTYSILIQASDRSSLNQKISQATVVVTVTDVNDTPPKCMPDIQTIEITRDFPAGAVLGKIYAYDPDTGNGGKLTYEIERTKLKRLFYIDKNYGILRTNTLTIGQLQKDLMYNISILVKDLGTPSLSTTCYFICRLRPIISFERPNFLTWENPIILDIHNRDQIVTLQATLEGSAELQYKIVDGSGIGDFKVDLKTGQISQHVNDVKGTTTKKSHYWLTVNAHLKEKPEIFSNVAVLLRETNQVEKAPYFDPTVYRVSIKENLPANSNVLQLSIVNPSSNKEFSDLILRIVDGNSLDHFEIMNEGIIRTKISLDREEHETYSLNISVSKKELPQKLSFASVFIEVEDVNDNAPTHGALMEAHIFEQETINGNGTFVTKVVAFDRDIGRNGELSFKILQENEKFQIDSRGIITTKAKLFAYEFYLLQIVISDKGVPPKSADELPLEVSVLERPRTATRLKFKQDSFTYKMVESSKKVLSHQVIQRISNLVSGLDGRLKFSIESGNEDNKFAVRLGNLELISELDYETKSKHVLVIKVTNGYSSDTAIFTILVEDINDNPPSTSQSCYQAEAMENEKAGKVIAQIEALDPDSISKGNLAYKLIGVDPNFNSTTNLFEVNEQNGQIKTLKSFDREVQSKYILTLQVEDRSFIVGSVLTTTYCVAVDIKDANDHRPRFTKPLYTSEVFSPIPAGVPVLRLLAVDDDIGTNALLKFSITNVDVGGNFSVDSVTGIISSGQISTSNEIRTFTLDVEVSDSGLERTFTDRSIVKITVYPAKPRPGFTNETFRVVVKENQKAKPVLDVSIPDIQVYYEVAADNGSSLPSCADKFEIDYLSGIISSKVSLDAEKLKVCSFAVHAWDEISFSSVTRVIVLVEDQNDNSPTFLNKSYTGSVDEGSGRGSEILDKENKPLIIRATDKDTGENAHVVYTIVEGSARRSFEIDRNTGKLTAKRVLDREKRDRFAFHVKATDSGSPKLFAFTEVLIVVNDINDRIPEFTQQIYRVRLYTPIFNNTEVTTVHANDGDSNVFSSVRYSLLNHTKLFRVSPASGKIRVKNCHLVTKPFYTLQIAASDGIFTSTCQVVINLSPIANDKFKFSKAVFQTSLVENDNTSRLLLILNVVGYEIGECIQFSIVNPVDDFVIDSNTGEIRTRAGAAFDREQKSHYELIVQARLKREPSQVAQGIVNVTVADLNDNKPVFIGSPYYQSVHIDADAGKVLLQVQAQDADSGSNAIVRYEITGGSLGKFSIDERSGVIKVKEKFIKGKTPGKFNIEVTAHDTGTPPLKTVSRVEVPVLNEDMPVFDQNYKFEVSENAVISSVIGKITAQGPNGRSVYYSIANGDEYNQFTLDFNSGELSTLDTFEKAAKGVYNLTVQATDSRSGSWSTTGCSVKILDVNNHRPMFKKAFYYAELFENASVDTQVLTVEATDKDFGDNARISYSLVDEVDKKPRFKVNRATGSISVGGDIDREVQERFMLRIQAADRGKPSLSSSTFVNIKILDVNDNPPVFSQNAYQFVVGDFTGQGQFIGKVSCVDSDRTQSTRYTISDSNLATVDVSTGILRFNRSPERGRSAQFKVHCSDGKLQSTATVTIVPEEVNEHKPTFSSESFSISVQENYAPSFLTVVSATDLDYGSFGVITYSIDSANLTKMFRINPTTGDVFSKASIDREKLKGPIVLPIRASDIGGRFDLVQLKINVVDVNDNDPVFEFPSYEAVVSAATPIGSTVLTVKAVDEDSGKNGDITYSIFGLDDDAPWKINKETGVFKLTGTPQGMAYQFMIKALDNGYPGRESTAMVRINVLLSEQRVLEFSHSSITTRIPESASIGYRVADVAVKSSESVAVYEFVEGNIRSSRASGIFSIGRSSGAIHLVGKLDFETTPKYSLMVKASDAKKIATAAYVIVEIIVENVNDNPPIFDSDIYDITIPENIATNSKIIQVSASDEDDPKKSHLRYEVKKSAVTNDVLSSFSLDPKTGVLVVSAPLDAESKSFYEIEIRVTDSGSLDKSGLYDSAKIRVSVLDTNDSPPVFKKGPRKFSVREDHVIGERVFAISAEDADKNPSIHYYIVNGNELGQFEIGESSGEVKLIKSLDREALARYVLTVVAYDGVSTKEENIEVIVTDANDNSPVCKKAFYQTQVMEGTATALRIARIEAEDPDQDDALTFTLQGDGVKKFLLNRRTGELMRGSGIDREKHATCDFRVLVTDKGGRTCYSDVYVEILDKNDNKPTFLQANYLVPVRENASLSSVLVKVDAVDADKGRNRKVTYRLAGSDTFAIQPRTGIILLEKPLNKNAKDSYELTVEAYDDGDPALASSATVNIVVLAETDRPPEFTKRIYVFSVSESLTVGSFIGKVETLESPRPSQGSVDYELITGDLNMFHIDRKTGELSLKKELDYEKAKRIALSVRARYTMVPSLTSVVQVTVNVTDENDNAPIFAMKSYKANADENVRAGTILQVVAEDADEGDNGRVLYRLVKSDENVPFKVDKQTGVISVAGTRPIDREEKDHYLFKVRAFDAGTPSQFSDVFVNVTITDLNDNPPEISPPNATVIVTEGKMQGEMIFFWTASDRDTMKNGPPFTYTIIQGDTSTFSVVDESDVRGSLITNKVLNRTKGSKYDLVVRVTDNGSPPQSALCYLTIHIVPPSDKKPIIIEPTMFFKVIKKPSELITIGRVRVANQGQQLYRFEITDGNDDNTFSIETVSGLIKGHVRPGIYTISVEVFDGKYTASSTVTIIVNRITPGLYKHSVVMTALDITADDFVNYKIKGFANHIRLVTSAKIENIIIWAVQTKDTRRKARAVGSRTDTDVAFAVKRTNEDGFIAPSVLQSSLILSRETLERKLGLSVLISVTDPCAAAPCPIDKKCAAVVRPLAGSSPSTSDLTTRFSRDYACFCLDGSKGPDCTGITACSSNPCSHGEKCIPLGVKYECEKDTNDGAVKLDGKDYLSYVLRESFDSVFKSITVSFRTEANEGYLFYAKGNDYCFLEIYDGKVRFKFDFGTGQGIVRIDDIQVNDGRWYSVHVIRNANRATLTLDDGNRKYKAEGRAKGENVKINLDSNKVFFGAGVISHSNVENGFRGCLRHPKLNGQLLPWNGNNSLVLDGRSFGVKRSCKDSGACKKTNCPLFSECIDTLSSYKCQCMPGHTGTFCKPKVTCADSPCRNGGTCTYFKANGEIEYRCTCRHPYTGAQCQSNSGLCASNPCKNGGRCENIDEGTNYRCICPTRYRGPNCELDTDPCASSPCFNGAKCTKLLFDFKCDCPAGTQGKRCGYGSYCTRYNCGHHGKCQETIEGPLCKCKKGYQGTYCQFDVNECLSKTSRCGDFGTCVNTIGSFFCNCTNGNNSPKCSSPVAGTQDSKQFDFKLVYYIGVPLFVLVIVIAVAYFCRRRSTQGYTQPRETGGPDIKYPLNCIELDQFPPQIQPRFVEGPPDYYTDGSADFAATALYDPSQAALSPQSTLSDDDRCLKGSGSSIDVTRKLLSTFKDGSPRSNPKGSANALDVRGSASDVSEAGDRLNGPYHWDYTDVPEDVMNRSKPTRTRSKEGSRMGLSYNYAYEETPKLHEKLPEKQPSRPVRRNSMTLNPNDIEEPGIPGRPASLRLSQQSLPKTETDSPLALRERKRLIAKSERSPTIQRAAASRGSDSSLLEPYEGINTQLSKRDFENRYSLTLEHILGGEYPAPPSETCPSDIESCTRPSLSVAYSDIDDVPYGRQRRMLPSEISCLDADNLTETSYNSDDDNDDYNETDFCDPDQTKKLEREIKVLIKELKSKTEADEDD